MSRLPFLASELLDATERPKHQNMSAVKDSNEE